jgi:hypothetical protein
MGNVGAAGGTMSSEGQDAATESASDVRGHPLAARERRQVARCAD